MKQSFFVLFALALASGAQAQTAPTTAAPQAAVDTNTDAHALEGVVVEPGGLTIEDTVRRAIAVGAVLGTKRADLEAANARITQTTVQFFPKLGVRASYTRLSSVESELGRGALVGAQTSGPLQTGPCPMGGGTCVLDAAGDSVGASPFSIPHVDNNYALNASLAIPLSDYLLRLSDAAAGAEASKEAAQLAIGAEERKVAADARVLYFNWLRTHAQQHLAKKSLERIEARFADARAAAEVGRLSNADVLRVEAAVANAASTLDQTDAARALVGGQLAIIMRDSGGGLYRVGSSVPTQSPASGLLEARPDIARELIRKALDSRLELQSIDAALRSFDHGEDAAIAGSYPRLDAVGDVAYANPNPRYFPADDVWNASWSAGLVLSMQLDAPFMSDAQAKELHAGAERLRASRRGVEAMVVNEVITALTDLRRAQATLLASQTSVRAAEEAYRVRTDLFQVGRATTTDILDAESELLAAKLATTNARIDLAVAAEKLSYAVGDR